jgi:predicted DNA-binding protein (MmcQ/YjbR family)
LGNRYETFTDYVFDEAGHTMAVGTNKKIYLFGIRDQDDELITIKLSNDQVEYYVQPTNETMPIETVFDIYQL